MRKPGRSTITARPDQALVAIPGFEDGHAVVYYQLDEPVAGDGSDLPRIARVRALAGVWSDLDGDDMLDELDRIRHANPPSPAVSLDD